MTASNYPNALDVITRIYDEFDKLRAFDVQQLLDGVRATMKALGKEAADPNAGVIGSPWGSFADIADILTNLARIQRGRFEVEYPTDPPLEVAFPHADRFSAASDVAVFCALIDDTDNLYAGQRLSFPNWSVRLRTSGADVTGFDFYRDNMDHSVHSDGPLRSENWEYIAMQESL